MSSNRSIMAVFRESSLLDAGSSAYLEQLYEAYLNADPSLPKEWRLYFEKLPKVGVGSEVDHLQIQAQFRRLVRHDGFAPTIVGTSTIGNKSIQEALLRAEKQVQVHSLIEAYRLLGHLQADLDPLNLRQKAIVPELMLSYHHLSEKDLSIPFGAGSLPGSKERPLQQIIEDLKRIYCGTFVSEFMHIPDSPERLWVQEQVEMEVSQKDITPEIRHHILEQLAAAEGLEKYLGAKYPGAKRFSLEGTDSLIVALDTIIQEGSMMGIKEVVIGMAHRGRLNVLVNLLGKTPNQLFDEFEGKHYNEKLESGDVKYHQGFSSDVVASGGKVHLLLAFNPSHLEIVTPVVCGLVKAKHQRR